MFHSRGQNFNIEQMNSFGHNPSGTYIMYADIYEVFGIDHVSLNLCAI